MNTTNTNQKQTVLQIAHQYGGTRKLANAAGIRSREAWHHFRNVANGHLPMTAVELLRICKATGINPDEIQCATTKRDRELQRKRTEGYSPETLAERTERNI